MGLQSASLLAPKSAAKNGAQEVVMGTITTASAFTCQVQIDGTATVVNAVVPAAQQRLLLRGDAVGFRVLGLRVGRRFVVTDVLTNQDDTGWQSVSFVNSWVNFGAPYGNVEYRRVGFNTGFDLLYMQGVCKNGTVTAGTTLFTLPSGYRPTVQKRVSGVGGQTVTSGAASAGTAHTHSVSMLTASQFDIETGGAVKIASGTNGYFGFDGTVIPLGT